MQLFGPQHHPRGPVPAQVPLPVQELAQRLPDGVHLGTSSWSFPGWRGLVWAGTPDGDFLAREGLGAYTAHPLLKLVGVDRSFYRPVPATDWQRYHDQARPTAAFLVKGPQSAVWARFPDHPRWGAQRGRDNPNFLDAPHILDTTLAPMCKHLPRRRLVLVLQLPPQPLDSMGGERRFAERVQTCMSELAEGARKLQVDSDQEVILAIEPRTSGVLGPAYVRALDDSGATHCVAVHPTMPSVHAQYLAVLQHLPGRPFVARWMLGVPLPYARAKARYAPFDRIVDAHPKVRRALARRIREAVQRAGERAFVSINNKAEGCAPLTIVGLAEQVVS